MVDLVYYHLLNSLFFGIPLLYYASFNSLTIFCLSLGEIYLSFGIPLITSSLLYGFAVILSAILLPIKSPVTFAVYLSISLPAVLANFLLASLKDLPYLSLKKISSKRHKTISFYIFSFSRFN